MSLVKCWSVVTALLIMTGSSAADDTAQCLDASSSAQDLRREKQLVAAREQLLVCARATCPGVVQRDCATWLAEVDAAIPTVVIALKDSRGQDVIAARVELDRKPLLEQLTGASVAIDPGVHELRVIATSGEMVEQQLVIREGEKNRIVELSLPPPPEPAPPPVPVATPTPPIAPPTAPAAPSPVDEPRPKSRRKLIGLGVMSLGGGAIVLGAVFGVKASSTWSDAKEACGDGCVPGSRAYQLREDARGQATIATVSMVVGGLAVAGGAVLFLTAPRDDASPLARGVIRAATHGLVGYGGTF